MNTEMQSSGKARVACALRKVWPEASGYEYAFAGTNECAFLEGVLTDYNVQQRPRDSHTHNESVGRGIFAYFPRQFPTLHYLCSVKY